MGLMQRFSTIFKAKASKTLDRYEDPRETLDYSYERTLEMLQKMRRAVADVATSRKRIELQAQQLQQSATKLEGQARQAMGQGREELAREALTRWERPALVLFSDADPIFSTVAAEHMASRIPGAGPAEIVAGAGHFLQEEKGEEIAARIVRFLAETASD